MFGDPTRSVLIARSDGPGTERFIGRALLDPLRGGSSLVGLRHQQVGSRAAADFLFAREGDSSTEMIRCHLDRGGRPTACEIWRVLRAPPPGALDTSELLELLENQEEIAELWVEPLRLQVRTLGGTASLSR